MARPVKLPRRFDAVLTGQRPATEHRSWRSTSLVSAGYLFSHALSILRLPLGFYPSAGTLLSYWFFLFLYSFLHFGSLNDSTARYRCSGWRCIVG